MRYRVYAGERYGSADDEGTISLDDASSHEIMEAALLWSAGRWPESDGPYEGCVWATTMDGAEVGREDVTIAADGGLDFPA